MKIKQGLVLAYLCWNFLSIVKVIDGKRVNSDDVTSKPGRKSKKSNDLPSSQPSSVNVVGISVDAYQLKGLHSASKRLVRRVQRQIEINNEQLADCYEQLGKYTRLMIVYANDNTGNSNEFRNSLFDNLTRLFYYEDQNPQLNKNSFIDFRNYIMYIIQNELGYYLNELEKNYKIINELQTQLGSHDKGSASTSGGNLNLADPFDPFQQLPAQFKYSVVNQTGSVDCSLVDGNGYIQIEIKSDASNQNSYFNIANRITVYCENGWLVIQKRTDGFDTNFNRTWKEYAHGFGTLKQDFWIGLEVIYRLTEQKPYELLIELTDWTDQTFVAKYDNFQISSEQDYYRLSLSGVYSGNASKDFLDDAYYGFSSQNGAYFSTYDNRKLKFNANGQQQQQQSSTTNQTILNQQQQQQKVLSHFKNCALKSGGGWWFNNYQNCLPVNLNGVYVNGASAPSTRGIKWQAIRAYDRNYALKKSKMKIKPKY